MCARTPRPCPISPPPCCPAPIACRAYRMAGRIRLTNKTPCGTYRAPGRYESTFVRERLMDAIAAQLGIDPIEVRRRNLIASSEMPYRPRLRHARHRDRPTIPAIMPGCSTRRWPRSAGRRCRRRCSAAAPPAKRSAPGFAMFVEKSGLGPFDGVRVAVDDAGAVEIVTGAASVGQGMETVMAQICADALGVDYARVRVVHGQTDRIAYGMGAFASRVTVMTGEATRIAATKLRAKALAAAAELLQTARRTRSTWSTARWCARTPRTGRR